MPHQGKSERCFMEVNYFTKKLAFCVKNVCFKINTTVYNMPRLKEGTVTLAELKKVATELKIKGRSKMKKKELMAAINKRHEEDADAFHEEDFTGEKKTPKVKKTKAPKAPTVPTVPAIKRQDSPTRVDKSKMKELRKSGRYLPTRTGKYRTKTPDKSSGYTPF